MKNALIVNVVFSSICGILLILYRSEFSKFFGVKSTIPFLILGFGLIFFSVTLLYAIKRQNPFWVLIISTLDLSWVICSGYMIIINPFDISLNGNYIITIVAFIVLLIALNQLYSLLQVDSASEDGIKKLYFNRTVMATKAEAWRVVSDVSNYHKVAPNIDNVKIISGKDQGMVRSCSHGKVSWTETCSLWEEEKKYSFIVNTSATDYPYPLKYLHGTWEVKEVDSAHTAIIMTFKFAYKRKIQNIVIHPLMRENFKKISEELIDNWQTMLEKE